MKTYRSIDRKAWQGRSADLESRLILKHKKNQKHGDAIFCFVFSSLRSGEGPENPFLRRLPRSTMNRFQHPNNPEASPAPSASRLRPSSLRLHRNTMTDRWNVVGRQKQCRRVTLHPRCYLWIPAQLTFLFDLGLTFQRALFDWRTRRPVATTRLLARGRVTSSPAREGGHGRRMEVWTGRQVSGGLLVPLPRIVMTRRQFHRGR